MAHKGQWRVSPRGSDSLTSVGLRRGDLVPSSCFLQLRLGGEGQPGVWDLCDHPRAWDARPGRTFHLNKIHLIRAMENSKPGLGKGNVLFHVKQTNKKMGLWEASNKMR